MQTYLFRGRKLSDGEWIFGSLISNSDHVYIVESTENPFHITEVDRDSVGQWTRVFDNHSEKIFEGDIVELYGLPFEMLTPEDDEPFLIKIQSLSDPAVMRMIMDSRIVRIFSGELCDEDECETKWRLR